MTQKERVEMPKWAWVTFSSVVAFIVALLLSGLVWSEEYGRERGGQAKILSRIERQLDSMSGDVASIRGAMSAFGREIAVVQSEQEHTAERQEEIRQEIQELKTRLDLVERAVDLLEAGR